MTAGGLEACGSSPRPRPASIDDIEHVVILMQENRSFDHYFGTYPGVRGFDDRLNRRAFTQGGLEPFHLDGRRPEESCTPDVDHEWGAQHQYWNGGAMDRFASVGGHLSMSYYARADLPLYHALADAFTICDRSFSSVIGPTGSNRVYAMSATIDPAGTHGGPMLVTPDDVQRDLTGSLRWTTMPEQLESRGISWKAYAHPTGKNLSAFRLFAQLQSEKYRKRAVDPTWPGDFERDVARDELPAVSWVHLPFHNTEHPEHSSGRAGEPFVRRVLDTLTAKTSVWEKTVLILTWDENGGFFDHVPPPAAPPGTKGEYLSVRPLPARARGVRGPVGLGARVPMLILSPFSRGGFVCSDTFDHASILLFLERRFGAEVPNITAWRRDTVGDLVSAFNFAHVDRSLPRLPKSGITEEAADRGDCPGGKPGPYPRPRPPGGRLPTQEPGRARRPSGPV